jgi:hypothetical protein
MSDNNGRLYCLKAAHDGLVYDVLQSGLSGIWYDKRQANYFCKKYKAEGRFGNQDVEVVEVSIVEVSHGKTG